MIARLKAIAAAVLAIATLAGVATGLAASMHRWRRRAALAIVPDRDGRSCAPGRRGPGESRRGGDDLVQRPSAGAGRQAGGGGGPVHRRHSIQ